jgi:hypothetical protein
MQKDIKSAKDKNKKEKGTFKFNPAHIFPYSLLPNLLAQKQDMSRADAQTLKNGLS